jgi:hypothetical protein
MTISPDFSVNFSFFFQKFSRLFLLYGKSVFPHPGLHQKFATRIFIIFTGARTILTVLFWPFQGNDDAGYIR